LKRAQICAYDLYLMFEGKDWGKLKNIEKLTAFADYKLPQILRHLGVISYSENLARKIGRYPEIDSGSQEEVEIRAATVWAVELIKRAMKKKIIATQIDSIFWGMGQDFGKMRPYHRVRTIYY